MARTQAVYYRDERGNEPVDRFIEALPAKAGKKINEFIDENLTGNPVDAPPPGFPISSQIEGELRELRIRFGRSRLRILYQRSGNLMVLLHAFEKSTEAVPEALTTGGPRLAGDSGTSGHQKLGASLHVCSFGFAMNGSIKGSRRGKYGGA